MICANGVAIRRFRGESPSSGEAVRERTMYTGATGRGAAVRNCGAPARGRGAAASGSGPVRYDSGINGDAAQEDFGGLVEAWVSLGSPFSALIICSLNAVIAGTGQGAWGRAQRAPSSLRPWGLAALVPSHPSLAFRKVMIDTLQELR